MKLRFRPRLGAQIAIFLAFVILSVGLLGYRLVLLAPGLNRSETTLPTVHSSLQAIWNQPLQLPLDLSRLLVAALSPTTGIGWSRLPNVLLGMVAILATYWLLRKWYGYRLAVFGTLLMATAPWFLHVARLASSDIIYPLAMVLLLLLAALWHQPKRQRWLPYVSVILIGVLLYVPGFIWLIAGVTISERRSLLAGVKAKRLHSGLALLLGLALLAPLIHAATIDWHIYRQFIGLPAQLPTPLQFGQHFIGAWRHIFINGYSNPARNLASLPIVDFLTSITFLVGVYLYSKHYKATRTRQLLYLWLAGTVLTAFNGPVALSLILPIVLVLSTGGIGYLLHLWLRVFPRNPLARTFGITLMGVVILFAVAYNIRNYYIAWPNAPVTKTAFRAQQ